VRYELESGNSSRGFSVRKCFLALDWVCVSSPQGRWVFISYAPRRDTSRVLLRATTFSNWLLSDVGRSAFNLSGPTVLAASS